MPILIWKKQVYELSDNIYIYIYIYTFFKKNNETGHIGL